VRPLRERAADVCAVYASNEPDGADLDSCADHFGEDATDLAFATWLVDPFVSEGAHAHRDEWARTEAILRDGLVVKARRRR
jgi:hypothetical protein